MDRIRKVSLIFRGICLFILTALPVLHVVLWANFNSLADTFALMGGGPAGFNPPWASLPMPLSDATLWRAGLATLIPLAIRMTVFYFLYKLFDLYARGEVFSSGVVRRIRQTGYALLAGQIWNPFNQALVTVLLTLENPPGQRMISVGASSSDVGGLLVAFGIILVSWIMDEGRKLQDEQALVI
jgi:hypothetical protein